MCKLSDAGLALHSELSLEAVLQTLADGATAVCDGTRSAVRILDRSGTAYAQVVGQPALLRSPTDPVEKNARALLIVPVLGDQGRPSTASSSVITTFILESGFDSTHGG
jgi:hypothetical protein